MSRPWLALRRNRGRVLEPACGDGALLLGRLPGAVAHRAGYVELPGGKALNLDFFSLSEKERFDTIIGNPRPTSRRATSTPSTAPPPRSQLLNGHAHLYLYFIEKCVRHLRPGGELIFITPRDFLKATGSVRALNTWLHDQGTLTDFQELGDARVFDGVVPNCAIWRFEKGNMTRRMHDGRRMVLAGGQLLLTRGIYSVPLSSVFAVKVGAVSGADDIFANAELGNADFVCSKTAQSGELRRMIHLDHEGPIAFLEPFRERLLARRRRDSSDEVELRGSGAAPSCVRIAAHLREPEDRNPRPFPPTIAAITTARYSPVSTAAMPTWGAP
ncbi:MAG: Eco57I restriction-modification methylase domain-containing protein [Rhodocyclaceae bacterium]|nr:Eco57I restriction-modification methylase domain-containing protein [Rhodocyclaceae bacterium]